MNQLELLLVPAWKSHDLLVSIPTLRLRWLASNPYGPPPQPFQHLLDFFCSGAPEFPPRSCIGC